MLSPILGVVCSLPRASKYRCPDYTRRAFGRIALFLPRSISKLIAWSFSMGVSEAEYLASLDLIHEAALKPTAWGKVLRQLAKLTNCTAGGLTVENPQTGEGAPLVYFGFDENHVE